MGSVEIIPAINVNTFEELVKRIKIIEAYLMPLADGPQWVHIDVADGSFTENTIWHNFIDLKNFQTTLNVEMHLMINNIDSDIFNWLFPVIKRNIFHLEAAENALNVIDICHEAGIKAGVAINPETPWESLESIFGEADLIQTLAVHPGVAGQEFDEYIFTKISDIRRSCPGCMLEVDGGVKVGIARKCVGMGANIIVAASAIFNNPDVTEAYRALKDDARL